jgi:hypothetical protein
MFKRLFKKLEYMYGPAYYGNTLGVNKNRIWQKYHEECKKLSKNYVGSSSEPAKLLKKNRMTKLATINVSNLANSISNYFGNSTETFEEMPLSQASKFATDIYQVLKDVEPHITSYYGSYFQPYWIRIQRTTPGETTAASSFGWHIDDNPKELMKIFVYLNDCSKSNGAFRAFSWKHSRKILFKGFRSNGEQTRVNYQPLVDRYLKKFPESLMVLEGLGGTVLAFDNNLVHKGTAPEIGFRHAIQIPIYPAKKPVTLEMVEVALNSPKKRDYPQNPYVNDFGY